jgi:hypothetical protein
MLQADTRLRSAAFETHPNTAIVGELESFLSVMEQN